MDKETLIKIIKFLDNKGLILVMFIMLLVLLPVTISLVYTNSKLEEQIYKRDNYIRKLQYTDSIARELLDYVETDSVRYISSRWRGDHRLTYRELAHERDSISEKYYNLLYKGNKISDKLSLYERIVEHTDTSVYVLTHSNGEIMTYQELITERDSIRNKYYNVEYETRKLNNNLKAYEDVLNICKKRFPFDYEIKYNKNGFITEIITTTTTTTTEHITQ